MEPLDYFHEIWARCDHIRQVGGFIEESMAVAAHCEDILRAELVARVSALDFYVHELVAQNIVQKYKKNRALTEGARRVSFSFAILLDLSEAENAEQAALIIDREIRTKHSIATFQHPEKIKEAIKLISECDLWVEVAADLGALPPQRTAKSKEIKAELAAIVDRRNKIAHEGDLNEGFPKRPRSINREEIEGVSEFLKKIVLAIDSVVKRTI